MTTGGGLYLNNGFQANGGGLLGTIRISGATIGGPVNLTNAKIRNAAGPALVADYLRTRSNMMLNGGFHAEGRHEHGTVRLVGAEIGGRLRCENGRVDATETTDLAVNLSKPT